MLAVDIKIQYVSAKINAKFELARGKGLALMGASGSGKSSILNVIAGFVEAKQGDVLFEGKSLKGLSPAERPLTMLFQEHNLFAHLNVWKNIALGLSPDLKLDEAQNEALFSALKWAGLEGMEARLPAALSGGQRQRVALARCLLRNQPLLLLDEPFAGLDASRQQAMREWIARLQQENNTALLLATHQQEDADYLCDEVFEVAAIERENAHEY